MTLGTKSESKYHEKRDPLIMVKKINAENNSQPILSNIPVSDSANPLVIDLPDGQKLVIGKLESGAVIEVATWRGTGRPDSRTNRLMLGMTSQADASSSAHSPSAGAKPNINYSSSAPEQKRKVDIASIIVFVKTHLIGRLNMHSLLAMLKYPRTAIGKLLEKSNELAPVDTTTELNINQWLQEISLEAQASVEKRNNKKPVTKAKSDDK